MSYNVREYLRGCLVSIVTNAPDIPYEVIVIDNASADGSADMVQREFPEFRLIRNSKNRGFAAACNQGIAQSRGKFVLLLNSDTRVLERALENLVAFMTSNPDVGVVACKNLYPDGTLLRSCCYFPTVATVLAQALRIGKLFPERKFFGQHRMPLSVYARVSEIDWASGAALGLRRKMLDEIGWLDEKFFFYGEEMELCYRARVAGWKVVYLPDAEVIHFCGKSAEKEPVLVADAAARSIIYFFAKQRGLFWSTIVGLIVLIKKLVSFAIYKKGRG